MAVCRISAKASVFGKRVTAHDLQHRREDDAPGTDAIFELLDIGGFLDASLRGIERHHQRRVKAGRAQRLDQKRSRLQVEQPLQTGSGSRFRSGR